MSELLFELAQMGVTFILCWLTVYIGAARERGRKPKPIDVSQMILRCGCQHALSFHDGLGTCRYLNLTPVYDQDGRPVKENGEFVRTKESCLCQQYTGELPPDWFSRDAMRALPLSLDSKGA